MSEDTHTHDLPENRTDGFPAKWLLLIGMVIIVGLLYWRFGDALSLDYLAGKEAELKQFQQRQPLLVYAMAFVAYSAITGLVPSAAALTLLMGWYFGFWRGVLLVSFASTTGATITFLLSRYFFRETVERKFSDNLQEFDAAIEKDGAFYLFYLRLIPLVPFFVINTVMGLTPLRLRTFWWVSQLGMLGGTMVYVYAGSSVPDLMTLATKELSEVFTTQQKWQIGSAFVLLVIFPLAVKRLMARFAPPATQANKTP